MTTVKTANPRSISNSHPAASTNSDNLHLDKSKGPVSSGRPRFPIAVWTPPVAPVVMGAGGIWASSLIEIMFAADQPEASVCLALESLDSP